jgi:hypothetical protein
MRFEPPPQSAAWTHRGARRGFEVVHFRAVEGGLLVSGCTTAIEDGRAWINDYEIHLDSAWRTRSARVTGRSTSGSCGVLLETDGHGTWRVDGAAAPRLGGCLEVDLECSAMTNALPIHRLSLAVGDQAETPAAYVTALDLTVARLEQQYIRRSNAARRERYDYSSPGFAAQLVFDESGLVLDYPGLAVRAG